MDSVAHAADSSSASADIFPVIDSIEWAPAGVLKVCLKEGPSFFIRDAYLPSAVCALLKSGSVLSREDADCLLLAGRSFLAERAAMEYLSRSEHSRFQLGIKLLKKGFSREESNPAFDYLEQRGFLDDARFASSWLRCRSIHRKEGRIKLLRMLTERGVDRTVACAALDAFFCEHDENALCVCSVNRLLEQGKSADTVLASLVRKGFPARTVIACIKNAQKSIEKVEILEFLEYSGTEET